MKIAIIGATGMAGSRITQEALKRGYKVTAIARHTDSLPHHNNLISIALDANDTGALQEVIKGHDVVILAVKYNFVDGANLLKALKNANINRIGVVGGAGSLEIRPGHLLNNDPSFPEVALEQSRANAKFLELLKSENKLEWTYISPSAYFFDGDAKGHYRFGKDQLLSDDEGNSSISTGDYALAMMDEIENPKYLRERFTIGY